jgi:hypothetical protein
VVAWKQTGEGSTPASQGPRARPLTDAKEAQGGAHNDGRHWLSLGADIITAAVTLDGLSLHGDMESMCGSDDRWREDE